jgi:hypothetical protein
LAKPKQTRTRGSKVKGLTWDEVRQLALGLPGVVEGVSYRTSSFKVNGKMIARFHQDREALVIRVEYAVREVLMGAKPETFYITDHYSCWPWMLVRISNIDRNELQGLLEEAWRTCASKRTVADWDTRPEARRSS